MFPEIEIFHMTIQSYGVMTMLGAAAAIVYCMYSVSKRSLDKNVMIDVLIYVIIGALIGGKLLYLLIDLPWLIDHGMQMLQDPLSLFRYLSSGFVFYGGLIGVFIAVFFYFYKHPSLVLEEYLEACMPAFPLFHCFGRIGCFLAGCCYGDVSTSIFAMPLYTQVNPDVLVSRYPIQLFEAGFNLVLFVCLAVFAFHRRNAFLQLGFYLCAYGTFRFMIEWLRGDAIRGVWLLSTSQWISLFLVPLGIWMEKDSRRFLHWMQLLRDRQKDRESIKK